MPDIFIPLQGPGAQAPKAPSAKGWQSPGYEGVSPLSATTHGDAWLGLRCDWLVVVDCDTRAAAKAWRDTHPESTWTRKTPHGVHFIYAYAPGAPVAPAVAVLPDTDIRAGAGSQIVFHAPGYEDIIGREALRPFNPTWLPRKAQTDASEEEWTRIPDGQRNTTLAAVGGTLRRQGMAFEEIRRLLATMNRAYCTPPLDASEVEQIARSVARYEPDPDMEFVLEEDDASDVPADAEWADVPYWPASAMQLQPPPTWLWEQYLPDSSLCLLEGEEGIGKGLLCTWAAVQVATGMKFGRAGKGENVLWYAAEDDPDDLLRRLYAAGYDPEILGKPGKGDVIIRNPRLRRLMAPTDIGQLEKDVRRFKPRLVILDPGRSYLRAPEYLKTDGSLNSENVVRPGMEALAFLAADTGATIVFVHHQNKMRDGSSREKSGGSGAFRQVARQVLVVAKVDDRHALSVEKANNSSTEGTLRSYEIDVDEREGTAKFVLGGILTEQRNIDEWVDRMRKLDANADAERFSLIVEWDDVVAAYGKIPEGGLAPTTSQLVVDFGISPLEAETLMSVLVERKLVRDKRWYPAKAAVEA